MCGFSRGFKVRSEHGEEGGSLLCGQAPIAHQPYLVQPGPAPLQWSVGECDSSLEGKELRRLLAQSRARNSFVEGTPVAASGIEPDEPILPEVERLMAHGSKAKHAEPGPKEPARPHLADHAINILLSEWRERIVEGCRKDIMVEETECRRFARTYHVCHVQLSAIP
jgi:hypothetical protein